MNRRTEWLIACVALVCAVAAVVLAARAVAPAKAAGLEGSFTPEEPMPVESLTEAVTEVEPDEDEDILIQEALEEQGYFREDIPLSYEEQDFLHAACEEFGVDYYIMVGLVERETNFRNIPGDGGDSQGYCQIQKKWWGGLMEEIGAEDLTVPRDNFRTACAIVSQLTERYDGDVGKALVAYNQGHYKGQMTKYANGVLTNAEKWREANG